MNEIPQDLTPITLPEVEWCLSDDVFIKQMVLEQAGYIVPQHSHKYAHTSLIAVGSVRVWKDGELWGDFQAPFPLLIERGIKHTFMSLEPSVLYCIHNVSRNKSVEILEEGTLPGVH